MFKKIAVAAIIAVGFVASAQARMEGYECFSNGNSFYQCEGKTATAPRGTVQQLYREGWRVRGITGGFQGAGPFAGTIRLFIIIEKDTSSPAAPAQPASAP